MQFSWESCKLEPWVPPSVRRELAIVAHTCVVPALEGRVEKDAEFKAILETA